MTITGVANASDFSPGFSQKGSITSVFLLGLTGTAGNVINTQNPLSNSLLDVQVWINFMPAPIISISFQPAYQQINIQVPWQGNRDPLFLEVFQSGNRATFTSVYANYGFSPPPSWSALFADSTGHALLQHASDYSPITRQNPARAGEFVIAYTQNMGPVANVPQTGYRAVASPPSVFDPTGISPAVCPGSSDSILVGGSTAVLPSYDGLAPGLVGIYQVNFQVPSGFSCDVSLAVRRTIISFPFGTCQVSSLQTLTNVYISTSALISLQ